MLAKRKRERERGGERKGGRATSQLSSLSLFFSFHSESVANSFCFHQLSTNFFSFFFFFFVLLLIKRESKKYKKKEFQGAKVKKEEVKKNGTNLQAALGSLIHEITSALCHSERLGG